MIPTMKPITTGKAGNGFTLYYPIYITDNISRIDLDKNMLMNVLHNIIPDNITITNIQRDDILILKISNIDTKNEAKRLFNILNNYFISVAINESMNIYFIWEVEEPEPYPFNFFPGWLGAIDAGWETKDGEDVRVDGITNITMPCIVDESKKIIDKGIGLFSSRNGTRTISRENLMNVIVKKPLPQLSDKQLLAIDTFLRSFSLTDQRLSYLLIFICLEILASDHCNYNYSAKPRHFLKLLSDYKLDIQKALGTQHNFDFKPEDIRKKLYDFRNEIAHKLNPDSSTPTEVYDAHRLAKAIATAIIKKIVNL